MNNRLAYYFYKLIGKPYPLGRSISFNSEQVTDSQIAKAKPLPISNYSVKYKIQNHSVKYNFELVSMNREMDGHITYKLRCIETSELISVDRTAFEMFFEKIKVLK